MLRFEASVYHADHLALQAHYVCLRSLLGGASCLAVSHTLTMIFTAALGGIPT